MSRVVVLTHLVGPEVWQPVLDHLPAAVDVSFVPVPGFRGTGLPPGPPTLPALAEQLRVQLAHDGLEDAHLVGISMAGSVALEVGRAGACRRVTAISPPGCWTTPEAMATVAVIGGMWTAVRLARPAVTRAGRVPALRRSVWSRLLADPGLMPEEVQDAIVLGIPAAMPSSPLSLAALSRVVVGYRAPSTVSVPTTVAWGDRDAFTPYATQGARARRRLPSARHVVLRGCGHLPTYDDPAAVARLLAD